MSKMSLEKLLFTHQKINLKLEFFNNASQHWNHILFWKCMKPGGGGKMPEKLKKELKQISEAQMSLKTVYTSRYYTVRIRMVLVIN